MLALRFFVMVLLSCVIAGAQERPLPKNLSGEWIRTAEEHAEAYDAPIWKRLLLSIRPWGEVGGSHGRVKLDTEQVTVTGGFLDNERFSYSKVMPEAFGLGISGRVEF